MAFDVGEEMEGNKKEIDEVHRFEAEATKIYDHKRKKSRDSYYQRKAKREFRSQGFGVDNNRMWDDE